MFGPSILLQGSMKACCNKQGVSVDIGMLLFQTHIKYRQSPIILLFILLQCSPYAQIYFSVPPLDEHSNGSTVTAKTPRPRDP